LGRDDESKEEEEVKTTLILIALLVGAPAVLLPLRRRLHLPGVITGILVVALVLGLAWLGLMIVLFAGFDMD